MANRNITPKGRYFKNITGQKFGRLTALKPTPERQGGYIVWECRCDCGIIRKISLSSLTKGHTKSCGCLGRERRLAANIKHGMSKSRIYHTWVKMHQRCSNPHYSGFKNWGGRGIKVCARWHKFENFYEDMGDCPRNRSLDRINNDGDYEPCNCRWATSHEQNTNCRPKSSGPNKQKRFRAWRLDQMVQYLSNNQTQFAREHKLNSSLISACLHNKRKQHKGWIFSLI